MAALPYMQFHIAEYLADTSHLTTEEHGAYLLLIFNYWQRGKALDNSNGRLTNVARTSNERWKQIEPVVREYFEVEGDIWTHTRIERDLKAVNEKCEQARNARKQRTHYGRSTDVGTDVQRREESIKRIEEKELPPNPPRGAFPEKKKYKFAEPGISPAGAEQPFDESAALEYWREMRARGSPLYEKEAPKWAREKLEAA